MIRLAKSGELHSANIARDSFWNMVVVEESIEEHTGGDSQPNGSRSFLLRWFMRSPINDRKIGSESVMTYLL